MNYRINDIDVIYAKDATSKLLLASTAHLDKKTLENMGNMLETTLVGVEAWGGCGWFLWTGMETTGFVPKDVLECLQFAKDAGCEYIRLDPDAPIVLGLSVYEHE